MLVLITPPETEPISKTEVKAQAVIDGTLDDTLLEQLISAARDQGEGLTERSFVPQTLEVVLDSFPSGKIELPRGPVTAITSVKYIDSDGTEQTLAVDTDYDEDTDSLVASVQPVDGTSWPDTKSKPGAVRVRYTAGWADGSCPSAIKQWLLIRVASLYAQRENHLAGFQGQAVAKMGRGFADSLLDPYTVEVAP